jgi:hypothetical protein
MLAMACAAQWLAGRLPSQRSISNLAMRYHDSAPLLFAITFPLKDLPFTLCRSPGALAFFLVHLLSEPQPALKNDLFTHGVPLKESRARVKVSFPPITEGFKRRLNYNNRVSSPP